MNRILRLKSSRMAFAGILVLFLVLPLMAQMREGDQFIRGFEVPEFDRDNRLRSKLFGELARLLPSGLVDITKMRIDFFDDNREVEMRVTADTCLYDRNTRDASSDTAIRIARENMIITGVGFHFQAAEGRFEIHDQAKVVLKDPKRVMEELE